MMPNQQGLSMSAMQAYIQELSSYVNENNLKYTKNLETITKFYEDQIHELHDTVENQSEEILGLKNENVTLRDVLQNRNAELNEIKEKLMNAKQENEELEGRIRSERERNQQAYENIDNLRISMQENIDREIERCRKTEEDRSTVLIQLKEKENDIRLMKTEIVSLEEKVAERYTMPERMKDLEIQSAKDKTTIGNLNSKINELTKERDFSQTELERKRKENEKLRIEANKSKGDLSYEIEKSLKVEREKLHSEIETIKIENDRKIFEIKDLEMKLKENAVTCKKFESLLDQRNEQIIRLEKEIKELRDDKEIYLAEFRKLKVEYEEVINSLEGAIPEYQKKHWALEQENQDLNAQLEGLQELLRELRAMNDMEPVRKEYRQWAELNLAADKKLEEQRVPISTKEEPKSYFIRENETDISPDWDKLLTEIEKIQI